MKKLVIILIPIIAVSMMALFTFNSFSFAGKGSKPASQVIPENVMKIIDNSCIACHSNNGNPMAKGVVNFSAWDTYAVKKQAKKSNAVCKAVTNHSMPPLTFIATNPTKALNATQIAEICDWANSLQPK